MSEAEFFEAPSDSFWEIGQYKRTVKRSEEGYKLCNDLMQMLSERANLEKLYAKSLKTWSKKWNEYLEKDYEYGTMKATWLGLLTESNKMCEVHTKIHDEIEEVTIVDIKRWQKESYPKTLMSTLKIVKQYEEEFGKAQKPWAKKYTQVEKIKKEYHVACKSLQTAKVQDNNAKNDLQLTQEQKKKFEDKVDKYEKEVKSAKHKYQQALEDINSYNSHYIEDMKSVYKKCDIFEKERLEFFIQKFSQIHGILDLSQKQIINETYGDLMNTIQSANSEKDLLLWSKLYGASMSMNWPIFEEYSEEFKNIAKGNRATKLNKDLNAEDNGVTMTSIRQKDPVPSDTSSIRQTNGTNIAHENSSSKSLKQPVETNPFDDSDEEGNRNDSDQKDLNAFKINNTESHLNIKVKAIYDYISTEDDELTFKAGEEFVKLANEDDRGWCLGKIGTKIGLYPATYAHDV